MRELSSGAEAKIFLNEKDVIVKKRIEKRYRTREIDNYLRISRTKKESKIIKKLEKIIPVPRIINVYENTIEMEYIKGIQLKKILDEHPEYAKIIGEKLSLMHDANIIHGDLTTSNMILSNNDIYFIDFGLSFESNKIEDKAVDIHLFKQSLESKHYRVF
ncbi:MAG: O-sialoglycoprotein endopeptidase [Candidatus Woesearchaeota archaeon]|nr:MAG: O-sialoglycoprotein endopeptidase [Candidatus Woesearchaeota archaeon]